MDETPDGLLRSPLIIALTTICLSASAAINRYPVLRRVSTLIQEGQESLARGDRVRALSDFREVERLEPADYRSHLQLSLIYTAFGQFREATHEYEWSARVGPDVKRIDGVRSKACNDAGN